MIRGSIFLSLLLLWLSGATLAHAQARKGQRLMQGYVTLPGESPRYYKIYFTSEGTKITGYSITANDDFGEMKATITGNINQAGTEIYIRELTELDHNSALSYGACFFTARLKRTERNGKYYYSGAFDSRMEDGTPCQNGIMVLIDKTPPRQAPPPAPPPRPAPRRTQAPRPPAPERDTTPPPPVVIQPKTDTPAPVVVTPPPPAPKPTPLPDTTGKKPLYHWSSPDLTFDISDGWEQDGDVVSVYFNDKVLLDHVQLSKEKRRFSVPLPAEGISTLRIELHGEGNIPPNTPRLQLIDKDNIYDLAISGQYKDVAFLYFTR